MITDDALSVAATADLIRLAKWLGVPVKSRRDDTLNTYRRRLTHGILRAVKRDKVKKV